MIRHTLQVLGAMLAVLLSSPARAAEYVITYTGTVFDSDNRTGEFGTFGSLDGLAFTAVYKLTYPTAGAIELEDFAKTGRSYGGGSSRGAPSPVSATLTINGVSMIFDGSAEGFASQANETLSLGSGPGPRYPVDSVQHRAAFSLDESGRSLRGNLSNSIQSEVNEIVASTDFTSSLDYGVDRTNDLSTGLFTYYDYQNGRYVEYVSGRLTNSRVTIAAAVVPPTTPAVPEPATWMMMIGGFALVGGAMRRGAGRPSFRRQPA